jgi:hypothetical protein
MKHTLPVVLAFLASGLAPNANSQTLSYNIPSNFTANVTNGETKGTINHKVTPPPAAVTMNVFQLGSFPLRMSTVSSNGTSTYWDGLVSISANGTITGSATVQTFGANGTTLSTANVTVSQGSKLSRGGNFSSSFTPQSQIPSTRPFYVSYGAYANGHYQIIGADFPVDILVRYSNNFTARGKLVYESRTRYSLSDFYESGYPFAESKLGVHISLNGPGGQTGFFSISRDF